MRALAFATILLLGCAALPKLPGVGAGGVKADPPRVTVSGVALVQAPSSDILSRYYCPHVAPGLVCVALGSAPTQAQLKFVFDVQMEVENPNTFPLPMVEALAAFTAYPGASGKQNLGAVCLSMCDDPATCPQDRADACNTSAPQIRTMHDFAGAAAGLLLAVATGQERLDNLKVKTLPAGGKAKVAIRLELNPEMILALIEQLAVDALDQVKQGHAPRFAVPFQVEGSVWVTVQGLGKIAAGYGPYKNEWAL